jgi:hypothetical protein
MTEPGTHPQQTRTRRGRGAFGVIWVSAALFLGVLALLAVRVSAGSDPALRERAAHIPLPPRRVLVRRVYERKVIVHLPPSAPPQATQASQQVSAGGSYGSSLPITRAS